MTRIHVVGVGWLHKFLWSLLDCDCAHHSHIVLIFPQKHVLGGCSALCYASVLNEYEVSERKKQVVGGQ